MRPLNLIPPEDRRGDSAPLRAGALSYAVVGVLAVALIAVVALVLTSNKINDNKSQLASLQAREAAAQQAAAGLAPYDNFATLTEARSATVSSLARSRFDWERVLNELALVIPEDVTLESFAATSAADATSGSATDSSVSGPSLDIAGCADGQEGTARFLSALRDIDGVTRVGMQSSTLNDVEAGAVASGGTGCEARPDAAKFAITVAFDAVPTASVAPTDPAATPATTPPATTTPSASTPTSNDGGVAQTEGEQQSAADSASGQTRKATNAANAVGVTK
jgi:Tfp pilus assembly protein PilN